MRSGHRIAAPSVLALALAACSSATTAGPASTPGITAAPNTASLPATPGTSTGPSTTPGGPTGSGAAPRCRSVQLAASLGPPEGAAGSVYRVLIFTDTGSQACTLQGFPGVSYVAGDGGQQVGPAAERVGDAGGSVRIAPGGTGSAQLQMVNVVNYDAAVCRPTPVRGLRIYPPGETAALFVPVQSTGCAGTPPGSQLTVGTIIAP
ncbi:MAG: hypothetical protein DLM60_22590 [Pseudonocardiales bacterium]|nr:MAG: hypothetical protein DLM60_22590 [Pseudonocardiales bacterium]